MTTYKKYVKSDTVNVSWVHPAGQCNFSELPIDQWYAMVNKKPELLNKFSGEITGENELLFGTTCATRGFDHFIGTETDSLTTYAKYTKTPAAPKKVIKIAPGIHMKAVKAAPVALKKVVKATPAAPEMMIV